MYYVLTYREDRRFNRTILCEKGNFASSTYNGFGGWVPKPTTKFSKAKVFLSIESAKKYIKKHKSLVSFCNDNIQINKVTVEPLEENE